MRRSTLLIFTVALLAQATQAAIIDISTGQTSPEGFKDPLWNIAAAPAGSGMHTSGAAYVLTNPSFWATPAAGTHYISAGDCDATFTAACSAGLYSYTYDFVLTDPSTASLDFRVAADNRVEVYLNNVFLYGQGNTNSGTTGFAALSPLQTVTSGFLAGNNTLELRVLNGSIYTGGVLNGHLTTPEPATMVISGLGLLAFGVLGRRRSSAQTRYLASASSSSDTPSPGPSGAFTAPPCN